MGAINIPSMVQCLLGIPFGEPREKRYNVQPRITRQEKAAVVKKGTIKMDAYFRFSLDRQRNRDERWIIDPGHTDVPKFEPGVSSNSRQNCIFGMGWCSSSFNQIIASLQTRFSGPTHSSSHRNRVRLRSASDTPRHRRRPFPPNRSIKRDMQVYLAVKTSFIAHHV